MTKVRCEIYWMKVSNTLNSVINVPRIQVTWIPRIDIFSLIIKGVTCFRFSKRGVHYIWTKDWYTPSLPSLVTINFVFLSCANRTRVRTLGRRFYFRPFVEVSFVVLSSHRTLDILTRTLNWDGGCLMYHDQFDVQRDWEWKGRIFDHIIVPSLAEREQTKGSFFYLLIRTFFLWLT